MKKNKKVIIILIYLGIHVVELNEEKHDDIVY